MPIKITPIKKKKKSPKGGGPLMTPGQKKMLDKQTGRAKPQEAKSGGIMKKAGGGKVGNVGKAMDKLSKKAIRKGGGSISEEKLISIMNKAGKSSGLFKKASGGKLKAVPEGKKGLSKLPTPVRNKMGFMKKGGKVTKKASGGLTQGMMSKDVLLGNKTPADVLKEIKKKLLKKRTIKKGGK